MGSFTDIFVRRPVLALVLSAVMLLLGLQAALQLTLREYPEVEKSVIFVTTTYPGASAETVQGFVTTPLQRRLAAAKGVEYVTSQSDPGVSEIEVSVRLGENSTELHRHLRSPSCTRSGFERRDAAARTAGGFAADTARVS